MPRTAHPLRTPRALAAVGVAAALLATGAGLASEGGPQVQADALEGFAAMAEGGAITDDGLFVQGDAAEPDHGSLGTSLALTGSLRSLAIGRENAADVATAKAAAKRKAAAAKLVAERKRKAAARAARARLFVAPVGYYRLSARFGDSGGWSSGRHTGLDFRAPVGTPVVASHDARVVRTAYHPAYGRMIILDLGGGLTLWYCHLSKVSVSLGERVRTGERIGAVGMSGNTSGPHLHFEVRVGDQPTDPATFLWGSHRGRPSAVPGWTYGTVQPFETLGQYSF